MQMYQQKPNFLVILDNNNKKSIIFKKDTLQAVITSRNVNLTLNYKTMPVYYVDNLCVHNI